MGTVCQPDRDHCFCRFTTLRQKGMVLKVGDHDKKTYPYNIKDNETLGISTIPFRSHGEFEERRLSTITEEETDGTNKPKDLNQSFINNRLNMILFCEYIDDRKCETIENTLHTIANLNAPINGYTLKDSSVYAPQRPSLCLMNEVMLYSKESNDLLE